MAFDLFLMNLNSPEIEALSVSLWHTRSHSLTAESVTVEFGLYSGEHSTGGRCEPPQDSESKAVSLLPRHEHYHKIFIIYSEKDPLIKEGSRHSYFSFTNTIFLFLSGERYGQCKCLY